jgi:YidC/Oxa1 family membrane protein insertase
MGGLTALYGMTGSYGIAIILLTFAIKLVLFPLSLQQIRSTKSMKDVQPLMEEAKRKYGKDRERLTQETMRIYKEHGVNPAMGCLPMLVQMPIWFGLYWALLHLAQTDQAFQGGFLWIPSLANPDPTYVVVVLTVVTQFIVQRMMTMPSTDASQQTMNKVMLFMPLSFGFIAMSVPSGLAIYWIATNLFTFFQQLLTTGWGELWPSRARPAKLATPRIQKVEAEAAIIEGDAVAVTESDARVPKAAKHKKRAGVKPPREEKRANGKR